VPTTAITSSANEASGAYKVFRSVMLQRLAHRLIAAAALALFSTTPASVSAVCVGDCDGQGTVAINEVQSCIDIYLATHALSRCVNCDQNGDLAVSISEVQAAINSFLDTAACPVVAPTATASPTATATPTRTPTRTATRTPIPPTRTATATPTPGSPLGTRTFLLSANSGFFSSLAAGKIGTLKTGALLLSAGPLDANGHASVTVNGPVLIQTNVSVGGTSVCTRIESCTGTLYCNGGANVDVSESVDSLHSGVACTRDGTNDCATAAGNVCCSTSCEAVDTGSGNPVSAMSMVNATDSGAGALLLTCTQINALFPFPPGDCGRADFGSFPEIEQLYTTGKSTAAVLHPCAGSGAPPNVIPMITATGQNFDCTQWTNQSGPGQLVYTIPSEEGSTVIGGAGDGANAGVWSGH
jgi:hypothetical protein